MTNPRQPEQAPRLSGRRLWLFRLITLVITPVLLLAFLEVGLRVAGFGYPASAFLKCQVDGKTAYCSNGKFGWLFFPREISRQFEPFVVPAEKSDKTYRIFVLGESAAQGDPNPEYGFIRQLMVLLGRRYPAVNFEVYNAAMTAINSHAILKIAGDCARLKPDLFIIYAGNNEVVGPYGAGTIFSPLSRSLALIRISIAIKSTRTGQLISRITEIAGRGKSTPAKWGGLEMFLGKQIRRDDEQMPFVYDHFRSNLNDIVKTAQKSGAKVILSTVAVNLKNCPPFASLNRADLNEQQKKDFDLLCKSGFELENAGDFNSACEKYLDAAKIDETFAELQFRIGRCFWNLGRFDEACQRYEFAKELDTLRFRADSEINRIISEIGKSVYFVDSAGAFEANSPHNCPGFELFLEHVHPTFAGNYLLAKTVFGQVEDVLPERIKAQKTGEAIAGEDICARRLAMTDIDRLRVMQAHLLNISTKPPYTNQAYHKEMMDFWGRKVEEIKIAITPASRAAALKEYEEAIKLDANDAVLRRNYAKLLMEDKRNIILGLHQYQEIIKGVPNDHQTLVSLANLEAGTGKIDLALKHAVAALGYAPTDSTANYTAGAIYQMKGQYKQAKRYLSEAIRLDPKLTLGYTNLGVVLGRLGEIDEAERVFRKGVEQIPDSGELHLKLALLLRQKGLLDEAEQHRRKAITLDPNLSAVWK